MTSETPTFAILTLKIERSTRRTYWRAEINELGLSAVGLTAGDAFFALGQNISAFAASCQADNKDIMNIIPYMGD